MPCWEGHAHCRDWLFLYTVCLREPKSPANTTRPRRLFPGPWPEFVAVSMREVLLQQIPHVWRAASLTSVASATVPSGFAELDRALGGGWPTSGLVEVLCDQWGIGELQLLLPLLKSVSATSAAAQALQPVLWINPPYEPHAVALAQCGLEPARHWLACGLSTKDALWTLEQSLRSGACVLVLAWLRELNMASLRRLKLAALSGACVAVLFRPVREAVQTTAANLRLGLSATPTGLQIELLKVRGRRPGTVLLTLRPHQMPITLVR